MPAVRTLPRRATVHRGAPGPGAAPPRHTWGRPARHARAALPADPVLVAGIAVAALLAAALRFPALGAHLPELISPDEPTVATRALAVLAGDLVPPLWDWPPASSYLLAGVLLVGRAFVPGLLDDPVALYGLGRAVFASVSVATVVLTGVLGAAVVPREARGARRLVAVGAAATAAVAYVLVRNGRSVHPEQLQPLLMIGALLCAFRLERARRAWPWVLAAGLLAGTAGATKYTGIVVALPVAVAAAARGQGRGDRLRLLGGVAAATAAGFVVGTLGTVLRWRHFLDGLLGQFAHQATGHLGYEPAGPGWWFHVSQTLPGSWGWPVTLLAVAGLGLGLVAPRHPRVRLVALAAAPVAVAVTLGQVRFPHYVVIAMPFLAVLAWLALARLCAVLPRPAVVAVVLAVAGSLVPALLDDVRLVRAAAATDTRQFAAARVGALDPGSTVWAEAYSTTGPVDRTAFSWGGEPAVLGCGCHVLVSSVQEERYRARPDLYADEIAVYDALRARGRVVDVVAPARPSSYRWDLLPQWGLGDLSLTGDTGPVGPTVTILDLRS